MPSAGGVSGGVDFRSLVRAEGAVEDAADDDGAGEIYKRKSMGEIVLWMVTVLNVRTLIVLSVACFLGCCGMDGTNLFF